MAAGTNREIIMDGFTMEDLLEEVQMQKELQEGRNERRREFEIRADVLAFLEKKKYPNYMEARFDNDWLYSNDLPAGLDIPAKDWPIARRLIKQLKNRDIAEHWVVDDETILTKPTFTGIPRNMIFDEREKHENWVPVQPTPPRITMEEINDLDLFAARRLKYKKVTPNGEKLEDVSTPKSNVEKVSSPINVQKEYGQKFLNADSGFKTNILKVHSQTENCDEGLDLKKTHTQINLNKAYKQIDLDAALGFKVDILKVHSQTENSDTGLDDLESLLDDIPSYLLHDTRYCKIDRAVAKPTKMLASETVVNGKQLDHIPSYLRPDKDCEEYKALEESSKAPAHKSSAERREELEELDAILRETEHLNQSIYTTHSDETVEKRFRTDTPWTDELITTHSAGEMQATKPFGKVDSGRESSRRPNVPVDGRSKRGLKRYQVGHKPLLAGPDLQERCKNQDEVSVEEVYRDTPNGTCNEDRLGGTHGDIDREVGCVKSPVNRIEDKTEVSEVDFCQRKRKGNKKKRHRVPKTDRVVLDENLPATVDVIKPQSADGVRDISDNSRDKEHNISAQRDKGIYKEFIPSPWYIKKTRQKELGKSRRNRNTDVNSRTRSSGRVTPMAERVGSPMIFPDPEPVGNTQPHPTLSRLQPSIKSRILNSLRSRLNRISKALCCFS